MDSSPLSSPLHGSRRKGRFSCRRLDKLCCLAASYFPLIFVYGLTTWAVYTEAYSICWQRIGGGLGAFCGILGVVLYSMALWAYTYAVFTPPGSPFDNKNAYSHLPTTESSLTSQVTVKADGQERFCKRCHCRKPDRTHHCSSCKVCVLKMDHHCPWLANCLGLYNYKAFLLFLIYTSIFCIVCFIVSASFVYHQIFNTFNNEENAAPTQFAEDFTPVNWILLAVVSGIIGLVLGGFTIWHLILTGSNMTTIESLEKVRYTAPSLRSGAPPPGARLYGDDQPYNPAHEHHREINRYSNYLVEESSKKLPHAFNLGWKKNFAQVFGGRDKMLYWALPMFSGQGDGWTWETSDAWRHAIETIRAQKEQWLREQERRERAAGWGYDPTEEAAWNRANPNGLVQQAGGPQPSKAERVLGRVPGSYSDTDSVPLRTLKKPLGPLDEISDDDDLEEEQAEAPKKVSPGEAEWGNWDD